jgi:hypothetical protein
MFKQNIDDPLKTLNIGKARIINWLEENVGLLYTDKIHINEDLSIDYNDLIDLSRINLVELPNFINFNYVRYFDISGNVNIKSMKGFPKKCEIVYCNFTNLNKYEVQKRCNVYTVVGGI